MGYYSPVFTLRKFDEASLFPLSIVDPSIPLSRDYAYLRADLGFQRKQAWGMSDDLVLASTNWIRMFNYYSIRIVITTSLHYAVHDDHGDAAVLLDGTSLATTHATFPGLSV